MSDVWNWSNKNMNLTIQLLCTARWVKMREVVCQGFAWKRLKSICSNFHLSEASNKTRVCQYWGGTPSWRIIKAIHPPPPMSKFDIHQQRTPLHHQLWIKINSHFAKFKRATFHSDKAHYFMWCFALKASTELKLLIDNWPFPILWGP